MLLLFWFSMLHWFCFGFLVEFCWFVFWFWVIFVKMTGCLTKRKSPFYILEEKVQHILTCHQKVHSMTILKYISKFAHNRR